MFVSKAGPFLSGTPLCGRLLALTAYNKLGSKGLPETNTQAYLAYL